MDMAETYEVSGKEYKLKSAKYDARVEPGH